MRRAAAQPTWALGWAAAVWWSRWAQPDPQRWVAPGAVTRRQALACSQAAPEPQALAGDGVLRRPGAPQAEPRPRRVVEGRPVSAGTTDVLAWGGARLTRPGLTAWLRFWDHASWHQSHAVRSWIRPHHQRGNASRRGVRMVAGPRPVQSPWLNPIAPTWVHGTRAISDPDHRLRPAELEARVSADDGWAHEDHLTMPKKVA